ncbi:MAG: family 16 glycoside hydrolase, partial [Planctomycetota bacterium]
PGSGFLWLILLAAALPLPGCASAPETPVTREFALFDGHSLDGWEVEAQGPWSVRAGSIYCPRSSRVQRLRSTEALGDDFELSAELAVFGRGPSDGKKICFLDAEGHSVEVSLDDDVSDSIMIYTETKPTGSRRASTSWKRGAHMKLPIQKGVWYGLRIVVHDGRLEVWHADRHIETGFPAVPPVRVMLEVQRSGAAFRGLEVVDRAAAPAPATSDGDEILVLFDGETLDGWSAKGPWFVEDGALVHPVTGRVGEDIQSDVLITGPCEVSVEMQLIRRKNEDGRGIYVRNGKHAIHARLDNAPDEFQLRALPSQHNAQTSTPLSEDDWYRLTLRVEADGTVRSRLDGEHELVSRWTGTYPAHFGMTCQRSGARFRDLTLRYLD